MSRMDGSGSIFIRRARLSLNEHVLGTFAANNVYFASLWGDITGYIASAYRLYRNYDGNGGTFGNISIRAASSDNVNSSVHAAIPAAGASALHIIALNRNSNRALNAHFVIASGEQFTSGNVMR